MARLLLVDDTETYLALEQNVLGSRHECLLARNGLEAVRMAREHLPQLILMDMSMPLMSGEEAVGVLRADPLTLHIPVLAVSAELSYRDRARRFGAVGFVSKPFDADLLVQKVEQLLLQSGRLREVVLVRVGGHALAVPLEETRALVPMPALSLLPGAPRHIAGILNLKGEAIPVFDLRSRLGLPPSLTPDEQLVLVAQRDGHTLGIAVDEADDVVELEATCLLPVDPQVAATFGSLSRALLGLWRHGERLLPVLSPLHLLPEAALEQLSQLTGSRQA